MNFEFNLTSKLKSLTIEEE